jgi:hypothetical protein
MPVLYAELSYGNQTIRFNGSNDTGPDGLVVSDDGIEGWYSSPELKLDLLERGNGDGAHDIAGMDVHYASRVVTVHFYAVGDARSEVLNSIDLVSRANGLPVRLRVVDDKQDTFVQGYTRPEFDAGWHPDYQSGTLTVECPRPERLGSNLRRVQVAASKVQPGGLQFGDAGKGLVFPLRFSDSGDGGASVSIANRGAYKTFPLISVTGPFPDGLLIQHDQGALEWHGSVQGTPLVLDCSPRSHTATMGGLDVSRSLVHRDFPVVPANGSISLRLMSAGGGWVTVESRDAWM